MTDVTESDGLSRARKASIAAVSVVALASMVVGIVLMMGSQDLMGKGNPNQVLLKAFLPSYFMVIGLVVTIGSVVSLYAVDRLRLKRTI